MVVLLQCVAEAILEKGLKGLSEMVPGGGYAYGVAEGAWNKYRERKKDAEATAAIERLANASFEQAKAAAVEAVRAALGGTQEPPSELELYLTKVSEEVRQALKRADGLSGRTVPARFNLASPDQVLGLLPARPPRFRPGDQWLRVRS